MEKEKETLDQMYLEQIEALKMQMESMVPGPEHDKLKAEHKKLLEDYVNRRPQVVKAEVIEPRSAKELSEHLSQKSNLTNRDYWEKTLAYRDAFIKEFGRDPFNNPTGDQSDALAAVEVADTIRELLNEYEEPTEFRIKMNTILKDDPAVLAKVRSSKK